MKVKHKFNKIEKKSRATQQCHHEVEMLITHQKPKLLDRMKLVWPEGGDRGMLLILSTFSTSVVADQHNNIQK